MIVFFIWKFSILFLEFDILGVFDFIPNFHRWQMVVLHANTTKLV